MCPPNNSFSCCRCHAAKTPGQAGYFIPGELNGRHEYQCVICDASYQWRRDGSDVYLRIRTLDGSFNLGLPGQAFPVKLRRRYWVYKLNPESWGIQNDEELHRVAWCEDINCMSRWRWERLSRLLTDTEGRDLDIGWRSKTRRRVGLLPFVVMTTCSQHDLKLFAQFCNYLVLTLSTQLITQIR